MNYIYTEFNALDGTCTCKHGFVNQIQSQAANSTIMVSWNPPDFPHNGCDHRPLSYRVQYSIASNCYMERVTDKTHFTLSDLPLLTYVLFKISPICHRSLGQEVSIGQTTGTVYTMQACIDYLVLHSYGSYHKYQHALCFAGSCLTLTQNKVVLELIFLHPYFK